MDGKARIPANLHKERRKGKTTFFKSSEEKATAGPDKEWE